MKGCVKHLTLCFLEEFSWPAASCCLVPSQEKWPSEMSKDHEPALQDSSPGSTLRRQVINSFHQLLSQSHSVFPHPNRRDSPGCHFQWRFQWKNVYEGIVGNAQRFQSCAKLTLTCWAPGTTCGLEMATVPHTDHCKKHKWLHNPGSPPLDIYRRNERLCPQKAFCTNCHGRFSHNSPKLKTSCISIDRRTGEDKDSAVCSWQSMT